MGRIRWDIALGTCGLKRLRERRRFNLPDVIREEIRAYQHDNNTVIQFFNECVEFNLDKLITKSKLYDVFHLWCKHSGNGAFGKNNFGGQVSELYEKRVNSGKDKDGNRCWRGISFRPRIDIDAVYDLAHSRHKSSSDNSNVV